MIRCSGISAGYGGSVGSVLRDTSFSIERGRFVALVGPNGSGKSTLLRILGGMMKPGNGEVVIDNVSMERLTRKEIASMVAYVPPDFVTDFPLQGFDFVMQGRTPHLGIFEREGERDVAIVRKAMKDSSTEYLATRNINSTSSGEKQRLLLARAMAQTPDLYLLDEIISNQDLHYKFEIFALLKRIAGEGRTVLTATHDLSLALLYCDEFLVLSRDGGCSKMSPDALVENGFISRTFKLDGPGFRFESNRREVVLRLGDNDEH